MSFKHIINTMNKIAFILIMTGMFFIKGYAQRTEVLTLGVFHFDFPNLDMQQISEEDQINVLSPVYQKEIELIASKLRTLTRMRLSLNTRWADSKRLILCLKHTLPEIINCQRVKCSNLVSGLQRCAKQRFTVQMHGGHKQPVSKNCWKTIARNNIRILKRVL